MSQQSFSTHRNSRSNTSDKDTNNTKQRTQCPECDAATKTTDGEQICTDCGLVVDDTQIDHGPEWRSFDSGEQSSKSRVGAPTTNMMHDKGLSTNIDWQNRDGYGNSLSAKKRQKMKRLRTWNERYRTSNGKERGLKFALGEIDRMASALGLPKSTRETASMVFRQAQQNDLIPGRSLEGIASAALYTAARQEQIPRSLDELATVSRMKRRKIHRAYRYICQELGLAVPNSTGQQYLPRYSAELDLPDKTEQLARELLDTFYETGSASGKKPTGLAAAAIYGAATMENEDFTQREIGDVAGVTPVTIRNRYRNILEVYAEETDTELSLA